MKKQYIYILSKNSFNAEGLKTFLESKLSPDIGVLLQICTKDFPKRLYDTERKKEIFIIDDYNITEKEIEAIVSKGSGEFKSSFIIYTGSNNILYLKRLKDACLGSLLHKTSPKVKLLNSVEDINSGTVYIDPEIERLINEYRDYINMHPLKKLTYRQVEIIYLISQGYRSSMIAQNLHISVTTEERHRVNIKERLNIKTADELRGIAFKNKEEIRFLLELSLEKTSGNN